MVMVILIIVLIISCPVCYSLITNKAIGKRPLIICGCIIFCSAVGLVGCFFYHLKHPVTYMTASEVYEVENIYLEQSEVTIKGQNDVVKYDDIKYDETVETPYVVKVKKEITTLEKLFSLNFMLPKEKIYLYTNGVFVVD